MRPPGDGWPQALRIDPQEVDASIPGPSHAAPQVLDADGDRLRSRRAEPIEGRPRRAVPGWYALAVDRWAS
jgi:hypothetical protein